MASSKDAGGVDGLVKRLLDKGADYGAKLVRLDNFFNLLTGLGTKRDKTTHAAFKRDRLLSDQELDDLFHFDDLAARIVSQVVDDALSMGMSVTRNTEEGDEADANEGDEGYSADAGDLTVGDVQEDNETMRAALEKWDVLTLIEDALKWGRKSGVGVILLGVEGAGTPETPLDDDKIKNLRFLQVLERIDLSPASWYTDEESPKWGEPETYYINPVSVQAPITPIIVHESRLIMFGGAKTGRRERIQNNGWDLSILQRAYHTLRACETNWDSVVNMMHDGSQAVMKLKGLIDMIEAGAKDTMRDRMEVVDMGRSSGRMVLLDADGEEFELVERQFAGVPDLVDRTWLRLSAATEPAMPVTILMGQAPAGLNATGNMDVRTWYKRVATFQERKIKPQATRLVRILARVLFPGTNPDAWCVEFPSLWDLTDQELAELRNKQAQTDKIYFDMGAVHAEEIALSRFPEGGKGVHMDTQIDLESRKAMLESEIQKAELRAQQPDPVPPAPGAGPTPDPNAPKGPPFAPASIPDDPNAPPVQK